MQAMRPCDDRDAEDAVIDEDLSSISTLSGGCGKKAGAIWISAALNLVQWNSLAADFPRLAVKPVFMV